MGTTQLLSVPYALHSNTSTGLTLPYSGTGSSSTSTLSVTNTGTGNGISGTASISSGYGLYGYGYIGTFGFSPAGYGVYGVGVIGVNGEASQDGGIAVHGLHNFNTGAGCGVLGESSSPLGTGIKGNALSSTGTNYGVYGTTASPYGYGVFASAPGTGIYGQGTNESGESYGVIGDAASTNGIGVFGRASDYDGTNKGVFGITFSTNGIGVHGYTPLSNSASVAVFGETNAQSGKGIYGKAINSFGTNYGVYGEVTSSSGYSGYFIGGRFYVSGKVGIGTTAADYPLVVKSTGLSTIMARFENYNSTDPVIMLRQSSNGSGGFYMYDGSGTNTIFLYGEGSSFILGNLGIGTSSPGYKLQVGVAGDGSQARANAWNLLSDARLKKDFTALTDPLGMVDKINGYYYYWNTGIDKTRQVGFSAQEVLKVIPEVVSKGEDGYLSIDYGKMTPLLLEAIKELKAENKRLKTENEKINSRLTKIETSMNLSAENNQ
jgi:hypothetical protein